MQNKAVRGGGFSVVAFDGLPQGLVILYGMCSINGNPTMTRQVVNRISYSTHDGELLSFYSNRIQNVATKRAGF